MSKSYRISKRQGDMASEAESENVFLKEKNTELAKALADTQLLYKHTVEEKNHIQRELFGATIHIKKLQNYINNIDAAARQSINCVVSLSNHATDILSFVNYSRRISTGLNFDCNRFSKSASFSPLSKTQAVKPMVDGHVIYSPTINLKRVNELSVAELQASRSSNHVHEDEDNYQNDFDNQNTSPTNDSFQQQSTNNRRTFRHISERQRQDVDNELESDDGDIDMDEPVHSNNVELNINDVLSTVQEEDELQSTLALDSRRNSLSTSRNRSQSGSTTQLPILSGVFRDVRVYLSPVDPLPNITKVRGSSKSHKFKISTDIQPGRSTENRLAPSIAETSDTISTVVLDNEDPNNSSLNATFAEHTCTSTPLASIVFNQSNISNHDSGNGNLSKSISARRRTVDQSSPKKLVFNRPSQATSNVKRLPEILDDPLEGPSNLLDNIGENDKLETLEKLGLSPVWIKKLNVKSETSPADAVLKRRRTKSNNANNKKKHKQDFVGKRKSEKQKSTVLSSKVAKVVLSGNTKSSQSPEKNYSKDSLSLSPKVDSKLLTNTKSTPPSSKASIPGSSSISPEKQKNAVLFSKDARVVLSRAKKSPRTPEKKNFKDALSLSPKNLLHITKNNSRSPKSRIPSSSSVLRSPQVLIDPLEGPSNLLDNSKENNKRKTHLSLESSPVSRKISTTANSVSKRRKTKSNTDEYTPKKRQKQFAVKRKSEKKKTKVLSSKVAKVVLARTTKSPLSPQRKNARDSWTLTPKKGLKLSASTKTSPRSSTSMISSSSTTSPKTPKTPNRRLRLKRAATKGSFKEPSLLKKLRRSK